MSKKFRILQVYILVTSVFLLLGSVTYAWFSKVSDTSMITIDSASLKVDVDFYQAGYFSEIPEEDDYQLVIGSLNFNVVLPGQKFYFKLVVTNIGSIKGKLTVGFDDLDHTPTLQEGLFLLQLNEETIIPILLNEFNYITSDIELEPNESVELYFSINVAGSFSNDEYASEYIKINKIKIRLDQIQEP